MKKNPFHKQLKRKARITCNLTNTSKDKGKKVNEKGGYTAATWDKTNKVCLFTAATWDKTNKVRLFTNRFIIESK